MEQLDDLNFEAGVATKKENKCAVITVHPSRRKFPGPI